MSQVKRVTIYLSAGGGARGGGAVNSSETAMYFEKTIMQDGS